MKLVILAIFALIGFWVVGAFVEHFQKKSPVTEKPTGAGSGKGPEADAEPKKMDPIEEACRTLQLTQPYTAEQLRAAYRQRMSQYHPDKVDSLGPEFRELAESKSKEINRAFDLLTRFAPR
jgi:DnaJ like chaperone protein